ncbi:twitching motility protein PilT [Ancylomarina salipaludis]|uniref:Twitching motility protein PilT n=1 Tax=Ancylomarina salipaludis TaxID=2501299 RepID=A0A4Q1JMC4_9BACT|nr:Mut7-C RNAse domain-containing protein [Ancylomarina salipaludis]RXQ95709.1 twitching motility protein PilT [Ancylomarina salipaludis]
MKQQRPEKKENDKSIKKEMTFRFYAELNDFLPPHRKQKAFVQAFKTPVSVRETIESLGIPLSEVDLIRVNDRSVGFDYKVKEGDYISVFPVFESMDISAITKLRKSALRTTRFVVDAHLGKLAKYLRMLGFDTLYRADMQDNEIIALAKADKRIILTRDKPMLRSKEISHGYFVRSIEKHEQLKEIVNKFDLKSQFKSFTRCMTCNTRLENIKREDIQNKVDQEILSHFELFYYCPLCDKVYWEGSHFKRMEAYIRKLIE